MKAITAIKDLVSGMEQVLHLPLAKDKLFLTGANSNVVGLAHAGLKHLGFRTRNEMKQFGAWYSGGRTTANATTSQRINATKKRLARVKNFSKVRSAIARKFFKAGAEPAMTHAASVWGINNTQLNRMTRLAHTTINLPRPCRRT